MKKWLRKNGSWTWLLVAFLWVRALVAVTEAVPNFMNTSVEPIPLEEVDFSKNIEGLYVSGTVYQIYDYYRETFRLTGQQISRDYVIKADDYHYMALQMRHTDFEQADTLMYATQSYLAGEDDGILLEDVRIEVIGVITKMSSQHEEAFEEYMDRENLGTHTRQFYLPYYIDTASQGTGRMAEAVSYIEAGIGNFLIGCLVLYVAHYMTEKYGHYRKAAIKYLKKSPDYAQTAMAFKRLMKGVPEIQGLRYNEWFICDEYNGRYVFGETKKIVWLYKSITKRDRYALTICYVDGNRQTVELDTEAMVDEHISRLQVLCPQAMFGYSKELDTLYLQDRNAFLNIRYYRPDTVSYNRN